MFNSGGVNVSVTFHAKLTASYSIATHCTGGGTASGNTNASVTVWMHGGTPSGNHGVASTALFAATNSVCNSRVAHNYGTFNQNLTSGTYRYGVPDYFDFHFQLNVYSGTAGSPIGSGATATGTVSFTLTSVVMKTS
ncbi:MAG: hypothetical protein L3K16_07760 [Thermoplasmata archaeon]|nr:hypothetical protein [Thermoplasmata archaeon]